jgi:hypothetical protein
MSIGKVLGFLGLTSDVTGYELDSTSLAIGLIVSVVFQLLKDNGEVTIEDKIEEEKSSKGKKVRFSNTK